MPADSRWEKKFGIVVAILFEIAGPKLRKVPVKNFEATEQGFNIFGDVSGRFLDFSFTFCFLFRVGMKNFSGQFRSGGGPP